MIQIRTTSFALGLLLASTTLSHAGSQGMIKANGIVCVTQSGIQAARPDMNAKQLASLHCTNVSTILRVDVLPPSEPCNSYLFVAATLPEKIIRYWVRRDELNDYEVQLSDKGVSCQE